MISALALILAGQLLGETIAYITGLPIPGPVIGMALMVGFLALRHAMPIFAKPAGDGALEKAGHGLLANLSLLFVPAGVGIVQRLDLIADHAFALATALLLSTLLSLLVGVAVFRLVAKRSEAP
jgi:holin-like protein